MTPTCPLIAAQSKATSPDVGTSLQDLTPNEPLPSPIDYTAPYCFNAPACLTPVLAIPSPQTHGFAGMWGILFCTLEK